MIPYAGYDPNENDFSSIPRKRFCNNRKPEIDVKKAEELRAKGLKWREVGVLLAAEIKRRSPFKSTSVQSAIRLAKVNH